MLSAESVSAGLCLITINAQGIDLDQEDDVFEVVHLFVKKWGWGKLKTACKEKKLNHSLHDLRDTYIVRQWAITGDIHLVSKLIAHSSIMQTVEYAQFKPNELIAHFPSLKEYLEPRLIDPNTQMEHTLLEHSYQNILSPLVGKQGI